MNSDLICSLLASPVCLVAGIPFLITIRVGTALTLNVSVSGEVDASMYSTFAPTSFATS